MSIITEAMNQHFLMGSIADKTPVISALQPESALPGDVIIWQVNSESINESINLSILAAR